MFMDSVYVQKSDELGPYYLLKKSHLYAVLKLRFVVIREVHLW